MLFPKDAREKICNGLHCPNKSIKRTKGFCIQKWQGEYVQIDSDDPSVVILFRDPTIQDKDPNREVGYVLDIDDPKKKINSTLFTFYKDYFLDSFPGNEIIYLDNFIRCKMPFTTDQLKNDFLDLSDPYATCCYEISSLFLEKLSNLKCLIISDVRPIIWLGKLGFLTNLDPEVKSFIDKYEDGKSMPDMNSTILLNKSFQLDNFKFTVFFFLHPNTLQLQYTKSYAPGKKYGLEFEKHLNMMSNILK